ncbi:MAG TPA: TraB domain-containing protein [candidate division Zixibacteria bacterium]|nr:TraB domain-containing protein [candidate division Zixibacteria bacterium]
MTKIIIIGITHIDSESHKKVTSFLKDIKPDAVCLELDEYRLEILLENEQQINGNLEFKNESENKDDSKDEEEQLTFPSLIEDIGFFENYLAEMIHTEQPGKEMLVAYSIAKELGAEIYLIDRSLKDLSETMEEELSSDEASKFQDLIDDLLFDKNIIASPTERKEETHTNNSSVNLEDLEKKEEINLNDILEVFKDEESLSNILNIFSKNFPMLYSILLEDRNDYMIQRIDEIAPNHNIVVVILGFGHVSDVAKGLKEINEQYQIEILK